MGEVQEQLWQEEIQGPEKTGTATLNPTANPGKIRSPRADRERERPHGAGEESPESERSPGVGQQREEGKKGSQLSQKPIPQHGKKACKATPRSSKSATRRPHFLPTACPRCKEDINHISSYFVARVFSFEFF